MSDNPQWLIAEEIEQLEKLFVRATGDDPDWTVTGNERTSVSINFDERVRLRIAITKDRDVAAFIVSIRNAAPALIAAAKRDLAARLLPAPEQMERT